MIPMCPKCGLRPASIYKGHVYECRPCHNAADRRSREKDIERRAWEALWRRMRDKYETESS